VRPAKEGGELAEWIEPRGDDRDSRARWEK
jgi:hypothetical protein